MTSKYRAFFGFSKEPFGQDIAVENLLQTKPMLGVVERVRYAVDLGAMAVITGDIGSGKSSSLRYATSLLHPSEHRIIPVTAGSGTIVELYRQICHALNVEIRASSRAVLTRIIRQAVIEIVRKKQKPLLIVDEASLLRLDVFAELHTLLQYEGDSKPLLALILAGQNNLVDNLMFRQSRALASRVVARAHMESLSRDDMIHYLNHHLKIAGCRQGLFSDEAATAVHQASGGFLRKANHLARGALMAAASQKDKLVSTDHVRIASTELF